MSGLIDADTGEIFSKPIMGGIEHSPTIGALFGALAKAQGLIQHAAKDSVNPHFRSRYADLASVWEACRDALAANGIAVIQAPYNGDDGSVGILTMLAHESGEWAKSRIHAKPKDFTAQSVGSVLTYLRRYSLQAMAGVAPAEDDDGNAASGRPTIATERADIAAPGPNKPDHRKAGSGEEEKQAIRDAIPGFEEKLRKKLETVTDQDALDKLWQGGVNARVRQIGEVDNEAEQRIIRYFSQKKTEILKRNEGAAVGEEKAA